jgi:hypothetical protein
MSAPSPFPCSRNPRLFDTGLGRDHKAARKALRICDNCPFQESCRRVGREGREFGVWGGETQPERFEALGITEADILPPDCETEMAYRRHRDAGEECEPCRLAHNARQQAYKEAADERKRKEKEEAAARKAEEQRQFEEIPGSRINLFHAPLRPVCGTERGYRAHFKKNELQLKPHPDCTCREAHRTKRATERAVKKEAKAAA